MFEKNYYTLRGVADELNIGESTIQYWQDQYHSWIPCKDNEKEKWYPRQAIGILRFIMESANSGMNEGDIEKELSVRFPMVKDSYKQEIPLGGMESGMQVMHGDTVSGVLKGLLDGLSRQQMRIADAQERRAAAEERKASAMEKRAAAQKLMADALNNVAFALQHTVFPVTGEGSRGVLNNRTSVPNEDPAEETENNHGMDTPDEEGLDIEMQERVVKSLLDDVSDPDDLSEFLTDSSEEAVSEPDDLSELLEGAEEKSEEPESELNDLSELLGDTEEKSLSGMDDLSGLLTGSSEETVSDLDDLSELIGGPEEKSAPAPDDLSELLESLPADADNPLNESSETMPDSVEESGRHEKDNTAIAETAHEAKQADAIPSEQPQKIPGDYKSKIIALIIQLKEKKGMGIDDVTEYMNAKGYKTISGNEKWDSRTITQIFEHVTAIRSENKG
ncbi:MAG: MerR family transcriptional regulator [Pseudomonadota bacterium]